LGEPCPQQLQISPTGFEMLVMRRDRSEMRHLAMGQIFFFQPLVAVDHELALTTRIAIGIVGCRCSKITFKQDKMCTCAVCADALLGPECRQAVHTHVGTRRGWLRFGI
jgi:hypothetical protein